MMRQEKVRPPSITQLKAVAKTPFLMPYPSMTLNRTLLGVNLPSAQNWNYRRSSATTRSRLF